VLLHPQLYTTEWTARHKPWKKFTKKQNISFFQLSAPAVSIASPLHWTIYVVNNNLKKSCLFKSNLSGLSAIGKSRFAVEWFGSRRSIPQISIKLTLGPPQMKRFGGTVKIKFGAPDIFPNAKVSACNFFQNQQAFWHNQRFMLLSIFWVTAQTG